MCKYLLRIIGITLVLFTGSVFAQTWQTEVVDPAGALWTSIAVDGSGVPHIAYSNGSGNAIMYATRTGTNTWNISTVVTENLTETEYSVSLDMLAGGEPHISYGTNGDGAAWAYLKHAYWNGSSWVIEKVDSFEHYVHFSSIKLEPLTSNIHILYEGTNDAGVSTIKYAKYNGSTWQTETADPTGGKWVSLTLDGLGNPFGSYNKSADTLIYLFKSGASWVPSIVETGLGILLLGTSIDCGSSSIGIAYMDATPNWQLKFYTPGTGIEIVDNGAGEFPSLKFDDSDIPHIAYGDGTNSQLKYAYKSGTWQFEIAATEYPEYISLDLDNSDNPHISYCSGSGLKYAYKSGGGGGPQFVYPPFVDFGSVAIGDTSEQWISLGNIGTDTLWIYSFGLLHGTNFDHGPIPSYLAPGETYQTPVRFFPSAPMSYTDTLFIDSNDPYNPTAYIGLFGSGSGIPDIWVSPDPFNQTVEINSQIDDNLTIGNNGSADLVINSMIENPDVPWLSFTPYTGTILPGNQISVTLTFNTYGLQAGQTYNTTIVIDNTDPDENPYILPVILTVAGSPVPNLTWEQKSYSVTLPQNGSTTEILSISNTETSTSVLNFSLTENPGAIWLTENPVSGNVSAGSTQNVNLTFNATGLNPGNYSTILKISNNDPDYVNGPPLVAINLNVSAVSVPVANISPQAVNVELMPNQSQTRELKIKNNGNADLIWNLQENPGANWLTESQTNGNVTPGSQNIVALTFNSNNLNAGTYTTNLIITTNEPPNPKTYQIPIVMEVLTSYHAQIAINPTNFTVALAQGSSADTNLWISNTGNTTLNCDIAIKNNSPWLSANPNFIPLSPGSQYGVQVIFNAGNLPTGTYVDSIKVTSNAQNQPVLYVPVTLMVGQGTATLSGIVRDMSVNFQTGMIDHTGRVSNASVELLLNGNVVAGPVQTDINGVFLLSNVMPATNYDLHIYKIINLPSLPINKSIDTVDVHHTIDITPGSNEIYIDLPISVAEDLYGTLSFLSDLKFYLIRWGDVVPPIPMVIDYPQDELQRIVDTLLTDNMADGKTDVGIRATLAQTLLKDGYLIADTTTGIIMVGTLEAGIGIASILTGDLPIYLKWMVDLVCGLFEELILQGIPSLPQDVLINGISGLLSDILEGNENISYSDFLLSFAPNIIGQLGSYIGMSMYVARTSPTALRVPYYAENLDYSGVFYSAFQEYSDRVAKYREKKNEAWWAFNDVGSVGDIWSAITELHQNPDFERRLQLIANIADFLLGNIPSSITACILSIATSYEMEFSPEFNIYRGPDDIFHPGSGLLAGDFQKRATALRNQNKTVIRSGKGITDFSFNTNLEKATQEYVSTLSTLLSLAQNNDLAGIRSYKIDIEHKSRNFIEAVKEREGIVNAVIRTIKIAPDSLRNADFEYRKEITKFYASAIKLIALTELYLLNPTKYNEQLKSVINTQSEVTSTIKSLLDRVLNDISQSIPNLFMLSPLCIACEPVEVLPGEEFAVSATFANPLNYPVENIKISLSFDTTKLTINGNSTVSSGKVNSGEKVTIQWTLKAKENAFGFSAFGVQSEIQVSGEAVGRLSTTSGVQIKGKDTEMTPSTGGYLSSKTAYAYRSPFNPEREFTNIRFSLAKDANVTMKIYDSGNNLVTTLLKNSPMRSNIEQRVIWSGRNDRGKIVANGVYFIVIETDKGERAVVKVAVLR
uniref:Choice-of-anchor D domain-containing protein n=1 Tax=candidate division WOR-3 bacterium TaxID=2052148 RepID=A0A7C4THB1_UNCW3